MTENEKLFREVQNGVKFAFDEMVRYGVEYSPDLPEETKNKIIEAVTYNIISKSRALKLVLANYIFE